ncbi:MAG: DUF4037 domain-containing protein [Hyphomicrobiales bacterium]
MPPESAPVTPPPVRSLAQIHEPAVRASLEEWIARPETLGAMLCGSRVLGWAAPEGDYDAFLYVTREHYRSLPPEATSVLLFAEGEIPRRMIGDFSVFSDEVFEEALTSPLDVDHWSYVDAVTIADRTGALETWRRRLAAFPEEIWRERAVNKYLQLAVAYHYAVLADVRGFETDRQMSLFRAALAGVHLWYTLQHRWAPPLKWWTRDVDRLEIRPDTRAVLTGAVMNPTIETATHLRDHLKTELRYAGITEVENVPRAFFDTLLPERRAAVYRDAHL